MCSTLLGVAIYWVFKSVINELPEGRMNKNVDLAPEMLPRKETPLPHYFRICA